MHEIVLKANEKQSIVLVHDSPEKVKRTIRLVGEGAEINVDEIFMQDGRVESALVIVHDAPNTKSRINIRGVVKKNGETFSHPMINVTKKGKFTDSFVAQKFLLLDENAHADAIPGLEIENNDVKCSHGATVCYLDEEKLFYLISRGISEKQARRMFIEGFLNLPETYNHMLEKWQE